MWNDDREQRKIYRIGKSAAYSIGGGLAIWLMALFYPQPEGSEHISRAFVSVSWLLIAYGIIMLTTIVMRQNAAPKLNLLFILFVLPACLYYIFLKNWPG